MKIPQEENKHTDVPATPKDPTFKSRRFLLTRREHLTIAGEENKYTNHALDPADQTFKSKINTFKSKINP